MAILPLGRDSVKPTTAYKQFIPLSSIESAISDPSTPDQLSIQLYVISIARAGQ